MNNLPESLIINDNRDTSGHICCSSKMSNLKNTCSVLNANLSGETSKSVSFTTQLWSNVLLHTVKFN